MTLECITASFVLFCGSEFNYTHNLNTGLQTAWAVKISVCEVKGVEKINIFDMCQEQSRKVLCSCPEPLESNRGERND